jgi:hypothetical protein
MSAVVAVMHESLTEGIKGFYKLRKAFLTLDGILQAEARYLKTIIQGRAVGETVAANDAPESPSSSDGVKSRSIDDDNNNSILADIEDLIETEKEIGGLEMADVTEGLSGSGTPSSVNKAGSAVPSELGTSSPSDSQDTGATTPDSLLAPLPRSVAPSCNHSPGVKTTPQTSRMRTEEDLGSAVTTTSSDKSVFTSTVDIFVHSGANMCFGILLLLISMVPPAFSRLLFIIGFKGDRDRGVHMLWQSTRFDNVNGAVAGLVLLGYYNGLLAFADILPSDSDVEQLAVPDSEDGSGEIVGYPKERCAALLADMRRRYPKSRLWKLEEARVFANTKRLDEAIKTLSDDKDSTMRQVNAISRFELSLNAMFAMDWVLMRDGFLRCVQLNDWSHSIYYYIAGCAELELYREARYRAKGLVAASDEGDQEADKEKEKEEAEAEAASHKKAAEELFRKVPTFAGRKRFMTRKMPFEVFVCRKVQKWEERASALGVDLADAPGVSPAMEMVYLWNGTKRMTPERLEHARGYLAWERCTAGEEKTAKIKEDKDEYAIGVICEAAVLRSLGRRAEARRLLETVLKLDRYVSAFRMSKG